MFESKVLRGIFGTVTDEIIIEVWKFYKEELRNCILQ
jgi:hypothetical protein